MKPEQLEKAKVLHIIDGFGAGGAETWLLSTVKYLKAHPELNLHFDFIATGGQRRIFDEEIQEQGCNIYYIKYDYQNFFHFRRKLIAICKENKYIAVHDHQDFISGWHFLLGLAYLPSIRIAHLHNPFNFVENYVANPLRWVSYKVGRLLTAILTTKITGTSNQVMDIYGYDKWPYKKKRVSPAYCGFNVSEFHFSPASKFKICEELQWDSNSKIALFVGRIDLHENDKGLNQKNPEFAFRIAKELVLINNEWKFIFVGFKGPLGNKLEEETGKLNIKNKISFLSYRKDIPQIMGAADILIFPSFWEGLGMVAVEAQASGLRVIASDTIPEEAILTDLVLQKPLNEDVQDWVNSILNFTSSKIERNVYQKQIELSGFSISNSVLKLLSLYKPQT